VYFVLLLKPDFFDEPEFMIKRNSERNNTLYGLTAHEAVLILARIEEKCAVETQALLRSVAEFLSISMEPGFHPLFLLPVF